MSQTVALVLDRDFGEMATAIAERIHVWLIDSEVNRTAAEPIWARLKLEGPSDPVARGVTLFRLEPMLSPEESLADILDTIVEHHSRMTVLEVYGVHDLHLIEHALRRIHFVVSKSEPDRVVCSLQE